MNLNNKRILVFGLGVHGGGLGVAQWLVKQGAHVTVTDLKTAEQLQSSLDALRGLPIEFVLGEHREQDFLNADLIVRNPAVPRESKWLQFASEHNIPVEMEMSLFVERLPRGMAQVIGITGTKGKTTTTLMTGAILKSANPKTVVAGNLRVSALELLDQIDADTPVVLELSSWQLEAFQSHGISPHIAAITNIVPDHLNRYRDMDDYAQAKGVIFRYQQPGDYVVLNFDNKILTRLSFRAFGKVIWTSATRPLKEGAYREAGSLVWHWDGARHAASQRIIDVNELRVPGEHNIANALTAIALGSIAGASPEQIANALREFRGAEHRQEFVREINGVRYINDTTATAPAAVIVAIETFAPTAKGIVLIAGGSEKGLDFNEMALKIVSKVRAVILLQGAATDRLASAIQNAGGKNLIVGQFDSMTAAVERAKEIAREGQIVLLSPGCASFGMFANEFDRGNQFKQVVSQIVK
ncbi:MAG: UDP-N-acetylmuramoyl-L-alanine--D-glutamate ligase [Chloroflexi bacterium]|nr:UDP-N-acetylmuramoyl-L-alanine--D-glutamate ligase [Chloroflexota bacterium]